MLGPPTRCPPRQRGNPTLQHQCCLIFRGASSHDLSTCLIVRGTSFRLHCQPPPVQHPIAANVKPQYGSLQAAVFGSVTEAGSAVWRAQRRQHMAARERWLTLNGREDFLGICGWSGNTSPTQNAREIVTSNCMSHQDVHCSSIAKQRARTDTDSTGVRVRAPRMQPLSCIKSQNSSAAAGARCRTAASS